MEKYDKYDIQSIRKYAEKSIGHRLSEYIDVNKANPEDKGKIGNLIQEQYFGIQKNNSPEPDFKDANLELKVFAYKDSGNKIRADQRLPLSTINYFEFENNVAFEESHLYKKCKNMIFVIYLLSPEQKREDSVIKFVRIYSFDKIIKSDRNQIIKDFNLITKKIRTGKSSQISESDTEILSAVRTGNRESNPQEAPKNDKALPRRFALKQSYMTYLMEDYIVSSKPFDEKLKYKNKKSSIKIKNGMKFDEWLIKKEKDYINKSIYKISKRKKIKEYGKAINLTSKQALQTLACAMFGISSNADPYLRKTNTMIKAIKLTKNNYLKESISLPTFNISDLLANDDWEESFTYQFFNEMKFVFFIFKESDKGTIYLGHYILRLTEEEIEKEIKPVWKDTKKLLSEGLKFTLKLNGEKQRTENNLLNQKDTNLTFVRCHASESAYNIDTNNINGVDEKSIQFIKEHTINNRYVYNMQKLGKYGDTLPNKDQLTKLCFWLKARYVNDKIIKEFLNKQTL